MAVRNIRIIRPKIWKPPIFTSAFKLNVTRNDGTVDDITDEIIFFEVEDMVTNGIGRFEFILSNAAEAYTNIWDAMNVFEYFKDYASEATTLRFRGLIEKVSYQDNQVKVTGRTDSLRVLGITVTRAHKSIETSVILKDLFDTYLSGKFTFVNVNVSTVSLTLNWYQKPMLKCIQELCTAAGFDWYIDSGLDNHFFSSGSVENTSEGMVHDYNLIEVGEFANDVQLVKNRFIIYGATIDGVQIIHTAEDTDSIATYGVREEIINDENVTDYTQAQEFGDFLLAQSKDPPQVGDVRGILLATVQPGEKIRLSSPLDNLSPDSYTATSYRDEITAEGLFTTVTITKEPRRISHIIKTLIEGSNQKQDTSANPNEMRFSYVFTYDTDSGTHDNTEITTGVLKLQSGSLSGQWTSDSRTTTNNITEAQLIVIGQTLTGASFEVSNDSGLSWTSIAIDEHLTSFTSIGKSLKIRVTITSTETQITSLSMMYK